MSATLAEYYGTHDRKAVIDLVESSIISNSKTWEVTFYIKNIVMQRKAVTEYYQAEELVEDFIYSDFSKLEF